MGCGYFSFIPETVFSDREDFRRILEFVGVTSYLV